ncbi:hypothetical protein IFM89_017562 [Coptis chinensis]|uniref:Uncharacterized protein n=1 Tax=Coptis chinensis TaxID=261450 RepID=A0A835LRK7_9MAGN|nr:hypothetical protein IFM89_017562 [Coptis chinensis]
MHQFFSPLSKVKDEPQNGSVELVDVHDNHRYCQVRPSEIDFLLPFQHSYLSLTSLCSHFRSKDSSFINMAAGANEDASHRISEDERKPMLPK